MPLIKNHSATEYSETHYDTIIIGSGAGGLAAGICLARAGQKVLVLEQHYVPGGWCHSFHLNGQRFSPGVHYIGLMDEQDSTNALYKGLGVANDLAFFRMNKKAYEHCYLKDKKIDIPAGIDNLYNTLSKQFPHEQKNLKKYLNVVSSVSSELLLMSTLGSFWDYFTVPYKTRHVIRYGWFSLKRVIDWHIKDPVLKGILNFQCGDYALPPAKASFPVQCLLMNHYFKGAFYPMGGGAGIVKAMTNALKKHGGEIQVKQKVKRILTENKQAHGVELYDGKKIFSKNVISNADPTITYLKFIGKANLSPKLLSKLAGTKYSATSLILFLTLDMDLKKAGLDSGNIWWLRNENLDDLYEELEREDLLNGEDFPVVFGSCPTLKDPSSFNGRYYNVELVTFIGYNNFKEFENEDYHSEKYDGMKKKLINKFLNNLEKIIPGAKQHIVQAELGTPKTNQFFINSTNGNVYGTEKKLSQIGPFAFKNKSEINNLYLCGASTTSHGVAGATLSGVETAALILNTTANELLKNNAGQEIRIYDAEDESTWPNWVIQKMEDRKRRFKETCLAEHEKIGSHQH